MKFLSFLPLIFLTILANAQATLSVEIKNGTATTTCTDLFSAPDPLWQVNIENSGWVTYPKVANCFTDFPNTQFSRNYNCPSDLPSTIEICFKAFENDGLVGCTIVEACSETICQRYPVPAAPGSFDFTLPLAGGLSSGGEVSFSISLSGNFVGGQNDRICGAIDLGVLPFGGKLGDAAAGGFNNFCASASGDPNPAAMIPGGWQNQSGVWFSFKTPPAQTGPTILNLLNDPLGTGDFLDLQVAVFESTNDTCTGSLTLLDARYSTANFDEQSLLFCTKKNKRYYVLVDGESAPDALQGNFGIEIISAGVQEGGDRRCDFADLGTVPNGGFVATPFPQSNYCATAISDPPVSDFVSQVSVYYRFVAPASGHIFIEAISDRVDSVGTQIAVYRSHNNLCSGFFTEVGSYYAEEDLDEFLELSCLTPGRPYFVLIDGDAYNTRGIFTIKISDLGDDTPIFNLRDTICAGQSITVGRHNYNLTGQYRDTFILSGGCDSVVVTDLVVLQPVTISGGQTIRATNLNSSSGEATVTANGGTGRYSFLWSDGQRTATATRLVGGQNYCVTVTDSEGCQKDTCIYVEYIHPILPLFAGSTLRCFGDNDGTIEFSVSNGEAPYQFIWKSNDGKQAGDGDISADNQQITLSDLPAGRYDFTVTDVFTDTTFSVVIDQPREIQIQLTQKTDASCFRFCDGNISVNPTGGVGTFNFEWSNGLFDPNLTRLCAGNYDLTVTDANGCQKNLSVEIAEPAEFIAFATQQQEVSCFGGADGIVRVATNGQPVSFQWSNGGGSPTISNLSAGNYSVTVTNSDGCKDTTAVQLKQPSEPVRVRINLSKPITCFGDTDGILTSTASGPGLNFNYNWSNGDQLPEADRLGAGWHNISVTNEKGCLAKDSFFLDQPEPLEIEFSTKNLRCIDPSDGGEINIQAVTGGLPGYQFSLDGVTFTNDFFIKNLVIGNYELVLLDALGCEKQYPFAILPPPDLTVDLGDAALTLELGDALELSASPNTTDVLYHWESTLALPCLTDDCREQAFLPVESGVIRVTVTDTFSFCEATDEVKLTVLKNYKVFIPNAISPNNDGINDHMMVFADASVGKVKVFKIFDRYGACLYEQTNFQPNDETAGWDGSWKGKALQPGVYVFFAEVEFIDNNVEIFKGDVTVVR